MQVGAAANSTTMDGSLNGARATVAARAEDHRDPGIGVVNPPTDMIGDVQIANDGTAGVVVAATIVGYVPPGGLMVQVQLEPTETEASQAVKEATARENAGLPAKEGGPLPPAVKQPDELSDRDRAEVAELQARDGAVRREEQAHAAAAGALAGPIQYDYRTGPDGRRYAVGGQVPIRDAVASSPEAAARAGGKLAAAAMSAQSPSAADYQAAADGYRIAAEANQIATENAVKLAQQNLALAI